MSVHQFLGVWPWPLTFRGHLRSTIFSPFESPYISSYLTSIDNSAHLVPFWRYSTSKFSGFDLDLIVMFFSTEILCKRRKIHTFEPDSSTIIETDLIVMFFSTEILCKRRKIYTLINNFEPEFSTFIEWNGSPNATIILAVCETQPLCGAILPSSSHGLDLWAGLNFLVIIALHFHTRGGDKSDTENDMKMFLTFKDIALS